MCLPRGQLDKQIPARKGDEHALCGVYGFRDEADAGREVFGCVSQAGGQEQTVLWGACSCNSGPRRAGYDKAGLVVKRGDEGARAPGAFCEDARGGVSSYCFCEKGVSKERIVRMRFRVVFMFLINAGMT